MIKKEYGSQNLFENLKLHKQYGTKRILLVDDEEFCLTTMSALLSTLSIDCSMVVDTAINGREALDRIIEAYDNGIQYSVIFMDFSMPVYNGIEATSAIRNHLTDNIRM